MPPPIRFHLDEHVDPAIAEGLRQRGIDVTTTVEVGLRTVTDDQQLAFVRAHQRMLVTNDKGFLALQEEHPGIAYYDQRRRTIGYLIRRLVLLWEQQTPEAMQHRVIFL